MALRLLVLVGVLRAVFVAVTLGRTLRLGGHLEVLLAHDGSDSESTLCDNLGEGASNAKIIVAISSQTMHALAFQIVI